MIDYSLTLSHVINILRGHLLLPIILPLVIGAFRCGTELMACSWDGTIAYLKFSKDEIGVPFTNSEMANFYQTVYGKTVASIGMNGFHNGVTNGTDPHAVVEDPEILKLQKQQELRQKEANAQAAANEQRLF